MKNTKLYKIYATVYFVIMSLQLIIIEGKDVSTIKIGLMLCSILFLIPTIQKVHKFFNYALGYLFCIFLSVLYNIETFRFSSFVYILFAIIAFVTYCNLLYTKHVFTIDSFIKILKGVFYAYLTTMLLQQIARFTFVGRGDFLPLNLYSMIRERSLFACNSLSLEPSHFARIIAAMYLSLLRMYECKFGRSTLALKEVFFNKDLRWVTIGFLWSIFSMGSGTAIIAFLIISLYFLRKKTAIVIISLTIVLGGLISKIQYEPIQRVLVSVEAAMTLDSENIDEADKSASARILPFIYTIEHFDIFDLNTWIGNGMDYGKNNDVWGRQRMIGGMSDYGFVSYIFALGLIYVACIRRLFSIETLFIIVLLMAEIRNVYVWWFVFMAFASTKYFSIYYQKNYHEEPYH